MQDKKTLITIIVLLVIVIPLTIIGTTRHFVEQKARGKKAGSTADNPNHDFIYNGNVYFYDAGKLLGIYECGNCTMVTPTIDDTNYHTNYFRYGDYIMTGLLANNIALFNEGTKVNYYNITAKTVVTSYEAIKNYSAVNNLSMTFVKQDGKWGALAIEEFPPINYFNVEYDYLSLPAHFDADGLLDASKLIAKKGSTWQVIDTNNVSLFQSKEEIVDFNNNYYVIYDGEYHVIDSANVEYLEAMEKNFVAAVDKYIVVIRDKSLIVYSDLASEPVKVDSIGEYEDLYFKYNNNKLEIYVDGELDKSIELTEEI